MKVYRNNKAKMEIHRTYDELLKQWKVALKEEMIQTRYGATHIIAWGKEDKEPLILFHGVGDDSALMWIYNAKALGEHFRLYAVDTMGGPGKSIVSDKYNKNFDDVLWIDDILDALKIEKTSLAGVSNGGYLVQLYSLKRPQRIKKAISMAASVPAGLTGSPIKTMMKIFLPEALFPTKENTRKLLRKLSGDNYMAFTENALILEHFSWLMKGFNNMAMSYHKVKPFTEAEVDFIRDKVYYLAGLDDPFEKLGGEAALREHHMNVKFYKGVGHGINHEIADEINSAVIDILGGK